MKIVRLGKDNLELALKQAADLIGKDKLVVIPSDTVYVLAAKATSSKAVQKLLNFKGRKVNKGISVFVDSFVDIQAHAHYKPNQEALIKALLPGPFTVVLRSRGKTAPELEPGGGTIGIRLVDHALIKQLTKLTGFPITATSANLFGKGPHYSVNSFTNTLSEKKKQAISLVVDAGKLPRQPTSTVVRLVEEEIKILRKGELNPKLLFKQETESEAETKELARKFFKDYLNNELGKKPTVVILKGRLGAGKTVFAQGIGELFGLKLTSPTFVLIDEYQIKGKVKSEKRKVLLRTLYHLDLFRVETDEEIKDLKLETFLKKGNLMLIEWGEKLSVFESLKKKNPAFYLLQIEDLNVDRRKFSLYQL